MARDQVSLLRAHILLHPVDVILFMLLKFLHLPCFGRLATTVLSCKTNRNTIPPVSSLQSIMGYLGLGEPSLGTLIIVAGAWINRDFVTPVRRLAHHPTFDEEASIKSGLPLPILPVKLDRWRPRRLHALGFQTAILTPNTAIFRNRLFSRLLLRFPFILEIIYWALIYSVYQTGRGFLASRLDDNTDDVACRHALQVIRIEQRLHIFWELDIQRHLLQHTGFMYWINRIYSFVHLPAPISFLVGLYWFAITRNRGRLQPDLSMNPYLYESRRRSLAMCNLLAFYLFSTWPCMPPRLLGDYESPGDVGELARSFGFIDTVHGRDGALSIFNTRQFTNQLAAMPSLHFGYSLLVGLSVMLLPLAHPGRLYCVELPLKTTDSRSLTVAVRIPSLSKLLCWLVGFSYPFTILVAIISTANHFILDAVVGAAICLTALHCNEFMLNLLPLEDYIFWCLRLHKPSQEPIVSSMAQPSLRHERR